MFSQQSESVYAPSGTRRSFETISIVALIATIVVAVLFFIPFSSVVLTSTKAFVLGAGALITLALFILARLSRGNIILPPGILVGALWLPTIAYVLSSVFSGASFTNAIWGIALEPDTLGFMLIMAVLGTLTAFILRRPENYRQFLRACAWIFGIVTAVQILSIVIGQFSSKISPTFSIVGSFTDLAALLGLGVICVLVTFRSLELDKRIYRGLVICSALSLFILAVANSSVVWILLAIVSLGLFVEAVMQRGGKSSDSDIDEVNSVSEMPLENDEGNHSLVPPLVVLAISLFFLIGGTLGSALANTLHVNILTVNPSWQSTLSVTKNVYTKSALFGSGPGTFGAEWLKYRDASLNSTVFWNTDFSSGIGVIPTSFVTTGIIGILAWVGLIALLIVFGLRTLILRAPQDPNIRYVSILSFVGAIYLFSLAIFTLPSAVILVMAFVFTGLFVSTMRYAANGRQWGVVFSRSPRVGFIIVFVLTILLLASVVVAYSLVEHYIATAELASANTSFSAGKLDSADKAAQGSISFAPSASAYQLEAGISTMRLNQIMSSTTMPTSAAQQAFQTALSSGINSALTATNLAPNDYQNWLVLGNLYAQAVPLGVSGAYDNAKTAYGKAKTLNPTNPQIPFIMARLDIAAKNNQSAENNLKAAIALKQDYTDAIFLLSQLEVQDGNVKDALAASLAAAYFTPNNPNILFQVGILYAAMNNLPNAAIALEAAVNASPQFANARYFLSAVYAKEGDIPNALAQMKAIAAMSEDNAKAVASQLTALTAGKNPFPANLLAAPTAPVTQP